MVNKTPRQVDKEVLDTVRMNNCVVCGARPVDVSHIRTRGSGGPDTTWNCVAKCRRCHVEWGQIGWSRFIAKYPPFAFWLRRNGWSWENGQLWHPRLAAFRVDPET